MLNISVIYSKTYDLGLSSDNICSPIFFVCLLFNCFKLYIMLACRLALKEVPQSIHLRKVLNIVQTRIDLRNNILKDIFQHPY